MPHCNFHGFFAEPCGQQLCIQAIKRSTAATHLVREHCPANQDAAFGVSVPIAAMNSDAFKIRHVQEQRQVALEPIAKRDMNRVNPLGDRRSPRHLRPHTNHILQRVALEFPVQVQRANRAALGERVADDFDLHVNPN